MPRRTAAAIAALADVALTTLSGGAIVVSQALWSQRALALKTVSPLRVDHYAEGTPPRAKRRRPSLAGHGVARMGKRMSMHKFIWLEGRF